MTQIIESLADIGAHYDAVLCDLWGCLHNGHTPFPAAVAALSAYKAGGGTVVLLTNAPRPAEQVRHQLERMGVGPSIYHKIVTSGDAAQAALARGVVGQQVYHLGPSKDDTFFENLPPLGGPIERVTFEDAQGIVCTGLVDDLTESPETYRKLLHAAQTRGLKLLCANPDIVVDFGDKRIWCAGALAALYTEMGGESLYFGKPHAPIYDLARDYLAPQGIPDHRILCIGDGEKTDVAGGLAEGFDVLFVTGGLAAQAFGPDENAPDPTLLADWLTKRGLSPTAAIGKLR